MNKCVVFLAVALSLQALSLTAQADYIRPVSVNGKYGYMNNGGKFIIAPTFDAAEDFCDDLAEVKLDGKVSYVTNDGSIKDKPNECYLGKVEMFSDPEMQPICGTVVPWGLKRYDGTVLIPARYQIIGDFSEGLAIVLSCGKHGYIDKGGKEVIPPTFISSTNFAQGLAPATLDNIKWGFIDKSGKFIIQPDFTKVGSFSENGFAVTKKNEKSVLIDKMGTTITTFTHNVSTNSSLGTGEDLIKYEENGKLGFVDSKGNVVIPATYYKAAGFHEEFSVVVEAKGGKWNLIDRHNKKMFATGYETVSDFHNGLATAINGNESSYVNTHGQLIATKKQYCGMQIMVDGGGQLIWPKELPVCVPPQTPTPEKKESLWEWIKRHLAWS